MKHIAPLTKSRPTPAAAWQEFLCMFINQIVSFLNATGSNIPLLSYLEDKCPPT
ncbi:MAG: hypothetical protein GY851_11085 [bacterium]|nr:hypothetical protein [bacterium]